MDWHIYNSLVFKLWEPVYYIHTGAVHFNDHLQTTASYHVRRERQVYPSERCKATVYKYTSPQATTRQHWEHTAEKHNREKQTDCCREVKRSVSVIVMGRTCTHCRQETLLLLIGLQKSNLWCQVFSSQIWGTIDSSLVKLKRWGECFIPAMRVHPSAEVHLASCVRRGALIASADVIDVWCNPFNEQQSSARGLRYVTVTSTKETCFF